MARSATCGRPTCYGDPGKVTDAEYHCATDDGGGVHTQLRRAQPRLRAAGGRRHLQRLDVRASASTRRRSLFWRPRPTYQTPTTDFADHADALEASCADLIGPADQQAEHRRRTPARHRPPTISAADCAAVTRLIAAVELRTEPTQCNFQPLLNQDASGPACGAGTARRPSATRTSRTDSRAGRATAEIVFPGGGAARGWPTTPRRAAHAGGTAGVCRRTRRRGSCTDGGGRLLGA